MAGGVSTPALAAAVSEAGGLGFLAAGYKDLDAVRADVDAVRSATARPFGINLFAPPQPVPDPAAVARYAQTLERHGALGAARHDDDGWEAKLALVAELAVPVVSVAFGCPDPDTVRALQAAGVAVWITVTAPAEARAAEAVGADALVVQGVEAGGHRATFDDTRARRPRPARGARARGGGEHAPARRHRRARDGPVGRRGPGGRRRGRPARHRVHAHARGGDVARRSATRSPATRRRASRARSRAAPRAASSTPSSASHTEGAPLGYPDVHHVTAPLRVAARERGDADGFHLWAGQAHALAEPLPAGRARAAAARRAKRR